jgi:hypothetical protein
MVPPMNGATAERIEAAIDTCAAAILAGAAVFALSSLGFPPAYVALGAAATLAAALVGLRSVTREAPAFVLPRFAGADIEVEQLPELVLTDEDRLDPAAEPKDSELVLDDILAELEPDSRVVRLFDPAAMPSPAQLKDRIDRHLGGGSPAGPPDASQALYDALAELRRSLR